MSSLLRSNNILTVIISIIIVLLLLLSSSFFRVLNKSIQNKYYNVKNEIVGLTANPHIIIVEIDDKSFSDIGRFPFPRSVYATFLENISEYKPAVVAFDILFLDPSSEEEDKVFIDSISNTRNVVLGAALNNKGEVQTPYEGIKKGSYTSGYLPPNIESSNNTVYSFTPALQDIGGEVYEHFSLQIMRSFYRYLYDDTSISRFGRYEKGFYNFSDTISYPLSSKNRKEMLINFIPPESFTRVSFADIHDGGTLKKLSKDIELRDAIILIGPAAEGLKDEFFTPNGVEYGVNVHANILNTLLTREYTMYFDSQLEWILIFFLVILSVSVNLSPSNKVLVFSNIAIVAVFWFIFPISILLGTNLILNFPSEIIFSLLLAFTSANIVKYLIEDTNKKKLNRALSEYVGENIADEILLEHGKVNLDGQEKNLVCFFSDIEGFTSLSERLTPGELVTFLREYLSAMTSIIMDKQGHVDKYEGDAIMALWGAFTEHSNVDYVSACRAALLQKEALDEVNKKWERKLGSRINARMGIHGGSAIIGNIGAIGKKMEFTALGDNINLASRLEGVNKFYGTYICVSEVVQKATKDFYEFRYLDQITVKGKDIPVRIYELLGEKDCLNDRDSQILNSFMSAIELYNERNFSDAYDIFASLVKEGDIPSQTYMLRCEEYITQPPEASWDGVYNMTEK